MKQEDPFEVYARLKERIEKDKFPVEPLYYELANRILPGDKEFMPGLLPGWPARSRPGLSPPYRTRM